MTHYKIGPPPMNNVYLGLQMHPIFPFSSRHCRLKMEKNSVINNMCMSDCTINSKAKINVFRRKKNPLRLTGSLFEASHSVRKKNVKKKPR